MPEKISECLPILSHGRTVTKLLLDVSTGSLGAIRQIESDFREVVNGAPKSLSNILSRPHKTKLEAAAD